MRRVYLGVVAACAVAGVLVIFPLTRKQVPPPPPPSAKPVTEPARPMVQIFPGHLEAQHTVSVDIAKPGTIESFFAGVGQDVLEGQILARLATGITDPDAASNAQQKKVDTLASALAELKLQAAKAKADAQHATDELARFQKAFAFQQKLNDAGATPRRVFEQSRDELTVAGKESAKYDELSRQADNRIYAVSDQLRDATVARDAATKQSEAARAAINAAEIHAPASGIVVARKLQVGQPTGPAEGKDAFQIAVDLSQLRAVFEADVATAARIHPGTQILLTTPGLPGAPIPASVTAIQSTHAQADFSAPTLALRPGMPCSVSVQLK